MDTPISLKQQLSAFSDELIAIDAHLSILHDALGNQDGIEGAHLAGQQVALAVVKRVAQLQSDIYWLSRDIPEATPTPAN